MADYQVIQINISTNLGSPSGAVQRATADLPDYICKNFEKLVEEPRLTRAYWKEEAAWSETGYYASLKNTSGQYQEVRVEYIHSNTQASWFILVKKQAIWTTHERLHLGKDEMVLDTGITNQQQQNTSNRNQKKLQRLLKSQGLVLSPMKSFCLEDSTTL
jgi:hypothetical protein